MSQRIQIVLPDPVAQQLRELAAGADTPPSTLAAQIVSGGVALAAKDGKVRPLRPRSSAATAASERRGLSPTAATPTGASRCGAPSSRCTAATPPSLKRSKTSGGKTTRRPRRCARSRYGEQNWMKPARTPATSSPFRTSSSTTPNSLAAKAAASPRHGSPVRRRRSGPRSSRRTNSTVTSLTRSVSASRHTLTTLHRLCTVGPQLHILAPATALTAPAP
jgi:hypothetical protein